MEISRVISNLIESLRPGSDAQTRSEAVEKTFQEIIKQQETTAATQTQKPSSKTPLHQASLHLNQIPAKNEFYTKNGQLLRMSIYKNEVVSKQLDSNSLAQQAASAPLQQEFKWPADIMATLMQMSFDFIREQLKREDREKRKKNGRPELPTGKAEEDALELLEILFDQFDAATDRETYCSWAEDSINRAEADLRERYTNLPPEVELRFKIMHDAILALRNGIEPDYIIERLHQEMKRKKDNQQ